MCSAGHSREMGRVHVQELREKELSRMLDAKEKEWAALMEERIRKAEEEARRQDAIIKRKQEDFTVGGTSAFLILLSPSTINLYVDSWVSQTTTLDGVSSYYLCGANLGSHGSTITA